MTDAGLPDASALLDGGSDAGPPPPSRPAPAPLRQWVDPFLGTGGTGFNDIGSAFPGPQRPFGMVRPGPDSSDLNGAAPTFVHCSGYSAHDGFIAAFSHTRMHGTGIADYGTLGVMPLPAFDEALLHGGAYRTSKVVGSEQASPGYYAVTLARGGITAELTATDHVAIHRYGFAASAQPVLVLDAGHTTATEVTITDSSVHVDAAAGEVSGFAHFVGGYSGRFGGMPVYFVARFDHAIASYGTWQGDTSSPGASDASGPVAGAWVSFAPASTIVLEVAISFVDVAGARANLAAESPGFDFDAARSAAEASWEDVLGRVQIDARSDTDFGRFYSALYHTLLMPTLASDVDGRYRGLDAAIHTTTTRYYTDFSLWDTYRTLHPWLVLAYPDYQKDMLRSLIMMASDGGVMPRWPLGIGETGGMLGDPAAIVFADSWVKGLRDYDLRPAYDALDRSARGLVDGRGNAAEYASLGYVSMEGAGGSTSKTLEFAYADYAMAILADAVGEDRAIYDQHAGNWRNAWDGGPGFFAGRHQDGTFDAAFAEDQWLDEYAEGNARQYAWLVPHDLTGLAVLMGGAPSALTRLEDFFAQSRLERHTLAPPLWYWHGNEPDLHACFVFAALGDAASSARWCRWVSRTVYRDGPTGLPGNDDSGTLSAWYVFAALGIYPIAATDYYLVGSPLVTRATIAIGDGVLTIDAADASEQAPYVVSVEIDGEGIADRRVPHARLVAGATLRLGMGRAP